MMRNKQELVSEYPEPMRVANVAFWLPTDYDPWTDDDRFVQVARPLR